MCIVTSAVMGVLRPEPPAWEKKWEVRDNKVSLTYESRDRNRQAWFRFVPFSINFWETRHPNVLRAVTDTLEIQFLENLFVGDVIEREDDLPLTLTLYNRADRTVEFAEFNFIRDSEGPLFLANFCMLASLVGDRKYFHEDMMTLAEDFLVNRGRVVSN